MIPLVGWIMDFHEKFKVGTDDDPHDRKADRWPLIREELVELKHELDHGNRPGIARELGDLVYLAYSTAAVFDIRLDEALHEIHRANMAKEGVDDAGRALKPAGWVAPNMHKAIAVRR